MQKISNPICLAALWFKTSLNPVDLCGSMRHQEANRGRLKQTVSHTSKYPFPESAVTIGTCHDEIDVLSLRQANELTGIGFGGVDANIRLAIRPMASQELRDIMDPPTCLILCIWSANLHNHYRCSTSEEGQRVTNSKARFPGISPAD